MFTRYRRSLLLSMIITCVVSKPKQIKNATATGYSKGNSPFLGIPWVGNRLRVRKCSFSGLEVRPETKLFFSQVFR